MAIISLNDTCPAAREALLESLAISRRGIGVRIAAVAIAALSAVVVLNEPLLLIWLAALLGWDMLLIPPLERRFVLPAVDQNLRAARLARAAMVAGGLALSQLLPFVAWSHGSVSGAVVGAAWVLCAGTQVFVYYSRDRLLLAAGMAPILLCVLLGPSFGMGVSFESIASSVFLVLGLAAGAAFVSRSDLLIAKAAEEASARQSAEASSHAKSRFIANMHHELRTPLNAIIGYTEMMREAAIDEGRREDVADLDRVLAAASLQLMMMSDLLAFAELQDGRSHLEPNVFDASLLLRETVEAMRNGVEANGNTLVLALGPELSPVHSDAGKLRHCVEHLLTNAGKFTRNGQVVVSATREHSARGDWLVVAVQDNGVGIPSERISAIFEPFTQIDDSMTRAADGAGVGLAIASRTARLLGGALSVESTPGRGSTFTLRVRADLDAGDDAEPWMTQAASAR